MLALLKENNLSLTEMRQMLAREEDPGGARALREDVRVAKALVGAARQAASDKSAPNAQAGLARLASALLELRADLPAARLTQCAERALQAISNYQAQEATSVASRSLLEASSLATKAPATLVPTVVKDLEAAKAQVDKQDLQGAQNALLPLLKRLAEEESLRGVDRALAAARGAQEALGQEAWQVLGAQLDYLDGLLAALQQKVEGAITPLTPQQAQPSATPAAPETGPAPAPPGGEAAPSAPAYPAQP